MSKPGKINPAVLITLIGLAVALVVGLMMLFKVTQQPAARTVTVAPSTRKAYPQNASAMLGRLDLRRAAALEADIPDDARQRVVVLIDEAHHQLTALLDDNALEPTTRDARMAAAQQAFARELTSGANREHAHAIGEKMGFIWFELDLLSRRHLLPLMVEHLALTPEQHKQADAAFMEVSVVLRNEPAGGQPNEVSMQAMLTGREKLHALLTPEQRDKFIKILHEQEQAKRQQLRTTTRPTSQAAALRALGQAMLLPTPATTTATTNATTRPG